MHKVHNKTQFVKKTSVACSLLVSEFAWTDVGAGVGSDTDDVEQCYDAEPRDRFTLPRIPAAAATAPVLHYDWSRCRRCRRC